MENVAAKILKKITMKELGATSEQIEIVKQTKKEVFLADVAGVATDIKGGETQYGPWTALKGRFVARDAAGNDYQSSTLIMPDIANDLILNELKDADENTHGVQFAFRIVAQPDMVAGELRGKGYKYGATPLLAPKPDDASFRLFALIGGNGKAPEEGPRFSTKALPAANAEPEREPETAANGKGKRKRA